MFRRIFWMFTGAGLTLWGRRKAIRTVEKHVPEKLLRTATEAARSFLIDVNAAQQEAKKAAARKATIETKGTVKR